MGVLLQISFQGSFARLRVLSGFLLPSIRGHQRWPSAYNFYCKPCDGFSVTDVLGRRFFLLWGLAVSKDRRPGIGRRHACSVTLGALRVAWEVRAGTLGPTSDAMSQAWGAPVSVLLKQRVDIHARALCV